MLIVFDRRLVTPALLALGLLVMLGGEMEMGGWIDATGLGYWLVTGWGMRLFGGRGPHPRRTGRPAGRPATPRTATVVVRSAGTDGVAGAFSRLDPAWRDWIAGEVRARKDTQP